MIIFTYGPVGIERFLEDHKNYITPRNLFKDTSLMNVSEITEEDIQNKIIIRPWYDMYHFAENGLLNYINISSILLYRTEDGMNEYFKLYKSIHNDYDDEKIREIVNTTLIGLSQTSMPFRLWKMAITEPISLDDFFKQFLNDEEIDLNEIGDFIDVVNFIQQFYNQEKKIDKYLKKVMDNKDKLVDKEIIDFRNDYFTIDLKSLIDRQKFIWLRYESSDVYNLKKNNATTFIKELDKYLFNITEEIIETLDVQVDCDDNKFNERSEFDINELIEEIIDVFNYSATTLSILHTAYNCIEKEDDVIGILASNDFEKVHLSDADYMKDMLYKDLLLVLHNVVSIRRLFGERKWHKPHPKDNLEMNKERLILSMHYMINCLKAAARILYAITKDFDKVNAVMNEKFKFIVELPDVTE